MQLDLRATDLITYVSVLATLMSTEGAIALAEGPPSLETDDLIRFLDEHRIAA